MMTTAFVAPRRFTLFALAILSLVAVVAPRAFADPLGPGVILAGAAERDITPRVATFEDRNGNGRYDMGDPTQPWDIGEPVTSFVEGPVWVGNGTGLATHVHGPLKVGVLVVEDPRTQRRVAMVSEDLYMVLQADTEDIRRRVSPRAGIDFVMLASTHTHMGPDTIGLMGLSDEGAGDFLDILWGEKKATSGVNPVWFDYMADQTARAIEDAAANLRPARVRVGQTHFHFGMTDEREPHIIDDNLMTLAVDSVDGKPIATVVQGTCHPESVLMYGMQKHSPFDVASLPQEAREAWGRVITPGFPGWVRKYVRDHRGGVPLYFSGALGGMITNITSRLWDPEQHPEYPADTDPDSVPETIKFDTDFRYAPIQGREMAKAALRSIEGAAPAPAVDVDFDRNDVLLPLDNPLFRLTGGLGIMGHHRAMLYDDQGRPDRRTRRTLKGMAFTGVKIPEGKNAKTEVSVVSIGPAQFINLPAEALGEITVGVPADFISNPERYYPENMNKHAHGKDFHMKFPPVRAQATRPYPFIVCLSSADFGYIIPEVDFKPPHDIPIPPLAFWWISLDASVNPHYEESMTATSKMEERIIGGVTALLDRVREKEDAARPK